MPARILVVDDDPITGELICEILLSAGMDAGFLTSRTNAAELLKRKKYHGVSLDMHMPPPDGVGLARQIRASRVNASTVIVMITAEEERRLMQRAFDAGPGETIVVYAVGRFFRTEDKVRTVLRRRNCRF